MINDSKNIKNIIFDFGGVVLDIDINKSIEAFKLLGIEGFSAMDIHPNTNNLFMQLEKGELSARDFFEYLLRRYPTEKTISQKELFEAWSALLLPFDENKINVIRSLTDKGYKLYILSNTNYPHRVRFLNNFTRQFGYDMESMFVKCYYSDEIGMRKPDVETYKEILKDAGLDPRNTMFIDDNAINIESAKSCGIDSYHLNTQGGETIMDVFRGVV